MMAEKCEECIMIREIERMQADITKGENSTKEILTIVSAIKDGHNDTKYSLLTITKTQEAMERAEKENKAAQAIRDRESKELFTTGFKNIEDKRMAYELKIMKEKEDAKKAQEKKDEALLREKIATKRAIMVAIIVFIINTVYNVIIKYIPHSVGL